MKPGICYHESRMVIRLEQENLAMSRALQVMHAQGLIATLPSGIAPIERLPIIGVARLARVLVDI